jgi:hypothetical protein
MNNISEKENRRDFLTQLGLSAVGLTVVPQLAATIETVEETESAYWLVGLYEDEIWTFFAPEEVDFSLIMEARQYAGDTQKRIVSAITKKQKGKKTIEFIYLEPVDYRYPETEEEED